MKNQILKTSLKILLIIISMNLLYAIPSFSQNEGDRILAIVGNDIILESDFQYQLQLYARQNQLNQINQFIAQQIFQQMITEKIILAKAEQDSIEATDEEVNRELDFRIKSLIDQFGTEQKLEEVYGMSLGKIKLTLRDELKKKLKTDKLKRKRFQGGIRVTDKEVRDFYNSFRDSLPPASEEFELSHIYMDRKVTDLEKKMAREKAEKILDSIKNGVDFSELAIRNSDDIQSAKSGGDLGYAKKGTFVNEFEDALFSLKTGEVSDIIETEFGCHIIKLNDKKGELVRSQHILVAYPKLESSDLETINFLKEIKARIEKSEISFEDAAKQYSQDVESAKKGGHIGIVSAERLDSNVVDELKSIPVGGISNPFKTGDQRNYGYEIFKVHKISPSHILTLQSDYNRIKKYAEIYKENKEVEDWINEIKESIYIDIK